MRHNQKPNPPSHLLWSFLDRWHRNIYLSVPGVGGPVRTSEAGSASTTTKSGVDVNLLGNIAQNHSTTPVFVQELLSRTIRFPNDNRILITSEPAAELYESIMAKPPSGGSPVNTVLRNQYFFNDKGGLIQISPVVPVITCPSARS